MTKSEVTPGPWRFSSRNWRNEEDVSGRIYVTGDHIEVDDGGGYCTGICVVEGNATSGGIPTANASLIAAAPDLLAACKELLPLAAREVRRLNDTMVGSLYPKINLAMLDRAEAAIRNAEAAK